MRRSARPPCRRNRPGEEFCRCIVRCARALVPLVRLKWRSRGDDRHPALRQWAGQRRERHIRIMRPFIGRAITQGLIVAADARHIGNRHIGCIGRNRIPSREGFVLQSCASPALISCMPPLKLTRDRGSLQSLDRQSWSNERCVCHAGCSPHLHSAQGASWRCPTVSIGGPAQL